jgi:hypothetical protein
MRILKQVFNLEQVQSITLKTVCCVCLILKETLTIKDVYSATV